MKSHLRPGRKSVLLAAMLIPHDDMLPAPRWTVNGGEWVAAMILPFVRDKIPEAIGGWLGRRRGSNPVGTRVTLTIDESGDPALLGRHLSGVILATASDGRREFARALVELVVAIDYNGHYVRRGIAKVVTAPYLRWHTLNRLLVSSSAVRVIDADEFSKDEYAKIIALATMRIDGKR